MLHSKVELSVNYMEKKHVTVLYRDADKSLARPSSRCTIIMFDCENISFDASLVYVYI